jgi:hypothetical protein
MTESAEGRRCRWCRRALADRPGPGRKREFCGGSCRQQEYLRRQRAAEAGLAEHELVVTRGELDELYDKLYVLEAAVEDVESDLSDAPTLRDYREAVDWLLEAARPLLRSRIGEPPENAQNPRSVK